MVAAEEARSHGIRNFRIKWRIVLLAILVPLDFLLFYLSLKSAFSNSIFGLIILINSVLIFLGVVLVDWEAKRKYPAHLP